MIVSCVFMMFVVVMFVICCASMLLIASYIYSAVAFASRMCDASVQLSELRLSDMMFVFITIG